MNPARCIVLSVVVAVATFLSLPDTGGGTPEAPSSSPPASVEVLAAQPGR